MLLLLSTLGSRCTVIGCEGRKYLYPSSDFSLSENSLENLIANDDAEKGCLYDKPASTTFSHRLASIRNIILQLFEAVFRIFGQCTRIFSGDTAHAYVVMRPLCDREELTAVHLISKGVDINVKRWSNDGKRSDKTVCSLLHECSLVNRKKILASEKSRNGYRRVKRRLFIEITVPKGSSDLSSQAAYTAIRLFYQRILQSALLPEKGDAVDRFIFEEYPYVRCYGTCNKFKQDYAEIMHSSAGLFWEAVEAVDIAGRITSNNTKNSFRDYVEELAKKKQIFLANRMDEFRPVPLPKND